MRHYRKLLVTASLSALLLAGCSGVKKDLGLTRSAPDEFTVVHRAPLSMPPDYELRPPEPGAPRPQDSVAGEAREAVLGGGDTAKPVSASSSDNALLKNAGADQASDNIRQAVDRETAAIAPKQKPVSERLLGWTHSSGQTPQPETTVVDPEKEAARLHKAQAEGKPPTAGETPTKQE